MADDKLIEELLETTSLADADLLVARTSPSSSPQTQKITKANLRATLGVDANTTAITAIQHAQATDEANISSLQTSRTTDEANIAANTANITTLQKKLALPQGVLMNGKIAVSVASNNLTVAIKTMAGADPSASDPVYVRIGDTVRTITAALSVTRNAGTNWCNAGGAELVTLEVDYFVYLGYNATDGVTIGFARIPYARSYGDFSAITTDEKYAAISTITTASVTDYYELIGRFAATLSAGAAYTWSVPTFTALNLIQRPIFETRLLSCSPVFSGYSVLPTVTTKYQISGNRLFFNMRTAADGTSNATFNNFTLPFSYSATGGDYLAPGNIAKDSGSFTLCTYTILAGSREVGAQKGTTDSGFWTNSGAKSVNAFLTLPI